MNYKTALTGAGVLPHGSSELNEAQETSRFVMDFSVWQRVPSLRSSFTDSVSWLDEGTFYIDHLMPQKATVKPVLGRGVVLLGEWVVKGYTLT